MGKPTQYQKKLIREHNAKMKIINDTANENGLSGAVLTYAAYFGIIGIPWKIIKSNYRTK